MTDGTRNNADVPLASHASPALRRFLVILPISGQGTLFNVVRFDEIWNVNLKKLVVIGKLILIDYHMNQHFK